MNPYEEELLPTIAVSVADVSYGVVLVLCVCIMLVPLAMLVVLVHSGIRNRRLTSHNESRFAQHSNSAVTRGGDRAGFPRRGGQP
jgi:hypothetical protein